MKHEQPPFRMVIERGKLVPATAYDAERLDSYRTSTSVKVRFVEERDRVLVRKWFAVIGRAVKECNTPWQTKDEASEAIKLALGIVNLTKTVGGDFMAYPKSLTQLTDPELSDAVEQMLAILYRITGVDPDDWRKHIADIGEDEPGSEVPSPLASEPVTSVSDQDTPPLSDDVSSPASEPVGAGAEAADGQSAAPASEGGISAVTRMLFEECIDNMLREAFSLPKDEAAAKIERMRLIWREPENLGAYSVFVDRCAETARRVVGQPAEREKAKQYLLSKVPA